MFSRQRAILRLIENEGGSIARLRLVKLAFLLSRESAAPRVGLYDFVPYKDGWRARREIIDRLPHHTRIELEALYESAKVSLGIVRPSDIIDLKVEAVERDWKP